MSQQPAVAAAPPTAAGPAAYGIRPSAPAPAERSWLRELFAGTPGRMRLFAALASLAAVVFGLVGAWTLWSSAASLGKAEANTTQVVRVQAIVADLLRADADATNAFLVGGLEDPAQRADYEDAMGRVATAIATAAQAQPADGRALAALNVAVQDYAALVEQARAYNRQGLPVGAQYLTTASDGLRTTTLPILESLRVANTDRATGEFAAAGGIWVLLVVGLIAVLAITRVAVWLAGRTHRRFNVGLSAGHLLVIAALVVGVVILSGIGGEVRRIQDRQFAATLALTTARSAAYDARANESLGLIARGQASVKREPAWKSASAEVTTQLESLSTAIPRPAGGTDLAAAWKAYTVAHAEVRALDDSGRWDEAVAKATAATESPRTSFSAFDTASATELAGLQQALATDTGAPTGRALATAVAVLLAGLAAAALASRGIAQRVEEYR